MSEKRDWRTKANLLIGEIAAEGRTPIARQQAIASLLGDLVHCAEITPAEASTLASLRAGTHVVVPREPTEAMIDAGMRGLYGNESAEDDALEAWAAMLAAAPEAPRDEE